MNGCSSRSSSTNSTSDELDRELHPFMVATQAHPEFKSRPTRPHPLFAAFVRAALDYLESERLPILDAESTPELVSG